MMRWTIRGISEATADAVRDLAYECEVTLGAALTRCIEAGLPEARRALSGRDDDNPSLDEIIDRLRISRPENRSAKL